MEFLTTTQEEIYLLVKSNSGKTYAELMKLVDDPKKMLLIQTLIKKRMIKKSGKRGAYQFKATKTHYIVTKDGRPVDMPLTDPLLIQARDAAFTNEQKKIVKENNKLPDSRRLSRSELARQFRMTKVAFNSAMEKI